jgi:hypothetical protein
VELDSLVSFLDSSFNPAFQKPELVSLVEFSDQLVNRAVGSDVAEEAEDVFLVAFEVDKCSQDGGSAGRGKSEDIDFDVLGEVVLVEVFGEVVDETVHVAEEHEGLGVSELDVHEELLDLLGFVVLGFSDDSFKISGLVALD